MKNKTFSPKIEIINHFDELINQVDIEFEECLGKYNEETVLGEIRCTKIEDETSEFWSESTKLGDYLNQERIRTIEELRKAQTETLEYYKLNSSLFKASEEITYKNKIDEFFGEKFYFQLRYTRKKNSWIFNLYTFVTDFYMSPSDIDILE